MQRPGLGASPRVSGTRWLDPETGRLNAKTRGLDLDTSRLDAKTRQPDGETCGLDRELAKRFEGQGRRMDPEPVKA